MSLPSGIIELEYIQSSGTQYVNTGFNPSSKSRIVFDFQSTGSSSDTIKAMFGARLNNDTKCFNMFALPATAYPQYGANAYNAKPITTDILQRTVYDMNANTTTVGSTTVSFAAETFSTGYPVYLFSLNDNGSPDSRYIKGKLYSCQIYDNGLLVRDYIPAKTIEGEVGLYDRVFHEFYRNAGTGEFIAGPVKITTPKAPGNFRVVSETDTEVALAWDADENAVGYRLYRDGALLADLTGTEYTDTATPFGSYTYHVLGYNKRGEGEAAELVVFLSPDNPILWLVTDRTQADVTAGNSKGVYRAQDLNRVGAAVKYLQKKLLAAGILADVSPRMDWADSMWMSVGEAQVYLDNVKTMRAALAMPKETPAAPDDLAKLTYAEANHMEMVLVILDTLLTDMVFAYRHCGTTVCGMGGLIL